MKRLLNIVLAIIIILTGVISPGLRPLAAPTAEQEELKEYVLSAMADIKEVMERSYSRKKDMLTELSAQGYDYELTSESFYEKGLPYLSFDYKRFIAAYTCIQTYCLSNGIDMKNGINDLDLVTMECEDSYIKEYIPERIQRYREDGDFYVPDGEYYLTEPDEIYTYEETPEGYVRGDKVFKDLKTKDTKFAVITLSTMSIEDVYAQFGLDAEEFKDEEEKRLKAIKEALGDIDPVQSTFVITRKSMDPQQDTAKLTDAVVLSGDSPNRQALIQTASTLLGAVPYEWGGKSKMAGYDNTWWTFNENGTQSGLDCSGYVQWVLRTAGYENWAPLMCVDNFLTSENMEVITAEELQPGDLGMFYPPNSETNHIGIYLGNGYWIHCSSSKGTVVIANNMSFALFRRIIGIDDGTFVLTPYFYSTENISANQGDNPGIDPVENPAAASEPGQTEAPDDSKEQSSDETVTNEEGSPVTIQSDPEEAPENTGGSQEQSDSQDDPEGQKAPEPVWTYVDPYEAGCAGCSEADLYLLAKIVQCEAHGEGFNGWVAVAEVIKNRMNSPSFKGNTIPEIVSASGQFSTYGKAKKMPDSAVDRDLLEACREVMCGQLGILNNPNVIAFKRDTGASMFGRWRWYQTIGNHAFYIK